MSPLYKQLSGAYVRSDRTQVLPQEMLATRGSPNLGVMPVGGTEGGTPAIHFDAAASETAVMLAVVPDAALTIDIEFWWTNSGAGAGDVMWSVQQAKGILDAGTLTSDLTAAPRIVTVTAPVTGTVKKTTIASGYPVATDVRYVRIAINRNGTDVLDTLANDAALLSVVLRKVT